MSSLIKKSIFLKSISIAAISSIGISAISPAMAVVPVGYRNCRLRTNRIRIDNHSTMPNYAQRNYGGPFDCGPVAVAMQLKYLDNNGYRGIFNRRNEPNSIINALLTALPYSPRFGTWGWEMLVPGSNSRMWRTVKGVAQARTNRASALRGDDDQVVSWRDLVVAAQRNNPVAVLLMEPGETIKGGGVSSRYVSRHWMTQLGVKRYVLGRKVKMSYGFGSYWTRCFDNLRADTKWSIVRSGWIEGSNRKSLLSYTTFSDWYTVELGQTVRD